MIKVNAGVMLFLLLGGNKRSRRISEFVEASREIEKQCSDVYVDIARKQVLAYVQHYPEYFTWDDNCVKRSKPWVQQDAKVCSQFERGNIPEDTYAVIEKIVADI